MNTDMELKDINVLLVEDDEDCGEFLVFSLEEAGMKVTRLSNAEEAINIMSSKQFDAVVTDVNLPEMSGTDFLNHLRTNHNETPVIIITGFSSVGSAVEALQHGAQDYLTKPLEDGNRLVNAVRKAVEHYRLTAQNKVLQERLVHAKKMESLGTLAGGVAHDLNNILVPMLGLPDILINDIEKACSNCRQRLSETAENLELIKASARRAVAMVRDLVISSRRARYKKEPVNANEIINNFLKSQELSELQRLRPEVVIETELDPDLSQIYASAPHLVRVIANLLRNALEAMDERITGSRHPEKKLTVKTSNVHLDMPMIGYEVVEPGDYVVIRISDTGAGIAKEDIPRIFEPFFTRKKESRESGTGLGLSVVNGIIKDHDGFVDVESAIGNGTTFTLYFATTDETRAAPMPAVSLKGGDEHVLIVDDEPGPRIVAKRFLRILGYEATIARNGHEALNLVEEAKRAGNDSPFDLLLLDMVMEDDFDGLATLEAIKEYCPEQKAVISSGYAPDQRVETALEQGALWLAKPYDIHKLAHILRQSLDGNSS